MDRYHHGALRAALLDAAEERFARGEEPSLRELARAAEVSPASVYHHFADKDALLVSLAVRGFERLLGAQRAAMDQPDDPVEQLVALGVAYVGFAQDHPTVYRLMMRKDLARPERYPELVAAAEATFGVLWDAVRAVAPDVTDEVARAQALELWATAHGMASLWDLGPLRGKLGATPLLEFAAARFRSIARRGWSG